MVCLKGWFCVKGCFVWRDGSCEGMCHFTEIRHKTIKSSKPFVLLCITYCLVCVNGWFVWGLFGVKGWLVWRVGSHTPFIILCITYYLVCVKGWFVWRDGLCEGINGLFESMVLCEGMVCVKGWFVWKPSLHTNQKSFSVLHPFTQNIPSHEPYIILCIIYYLVCVKGDDKWLHPFTQTIPSHKPFIILRINPFP